MRCSLSLGVTRGLAGQVASAGDAQRLWESWQVAQDPDSWTLMPCRGWLHLSLFGWWPPLLDASSVLPIFLAWDEVARGCPRFVLGYLSEQGVGFPHGEQAASGAPLLQGCHILPLPRAKIKLAHSFFILCSGVRCGEH